MTAKHIYAMHDPGTWMGMVNAAGKSGWCVYTVEVGHDNPTGVQGQVFGDGAVTPIVRINNGYGTAGSIPLPEHYDGFAACAAALVQRSQGCTRWIVGNEALQLPWEFAEGRQPTLDQYCDCYRKVYTAITAVQPEAEIMPGALAPWNDLCKYPGNEKGDWIKLQTDLLTRLAGIVGGIVLHAYSKGYDIGSLRSGAKMDPPFQDRAFGFPVLWELMAAIPGNLRHLPCYATECNGDTTWPDQNTGWVQAMYATIDKWNRSGGQQILCAALFRWAAHDQHWDISRRTGSVSDFGMALQQDYRHFYGQQQAPAPVIIPVTLVGGQARVAASGLRLRTSPHSGAQICVMPAGAVVEILQMVGGWAKVGSARYGEGWSSLEYLELG